MLRELQMLLCRKLNIDNTNAKYSDYNENYSKIIFVDPVTKKWSLGDSTEGNSNTTIPDYNPDNVYNEEDLFYYNSDDYEKNLTYVSGIYKSLINENKNFNSWEEYEVPPYIEATFSEYNVNEYRYWVAPDINIGIGDNVLLKPSQDLIKRGYSSYLIIDCPTNIPAAEFPSTFTELSIPIIEDINYFLNQIPDCETYLNNSFELYFKDGIFYKLISCPVSDFGLANYVLENSQLLADYSKNDFIPLTGTEEGNPITGALITDVGAYTGYNREDIIYSTFSGGEDDLQITYINADQSKTNCNLIQSIIRPSYFYDNVSGLTFAYVDIYTIHDRGDGNGEQKSIGLRGRYDYSDTLPEDKLIYAQRQYVDNVAGTKQDVLNEINLGEIIDTQLSIKMTPSATDELVTLDSITGEAVTINVNAQMLITMLNSASPAELSTIKSILGIV
jgi:hypothetical protein